MPSEKSTFSRQLGMLLEKSGAKPHVVCETSLTDVVIQLAGEGLGIGFASSVIARRSCPSSCRVVPLRDKIYRSVYYVTMKDLLDYPTIESFTRFMESYRF